MPVDNHSCNAPPPRFAVQLLRAEPSSASLRVGDARKRVSGASLARSGCSRSFFRAVKQTLEGALFCRKNRDFLLLQPLDNQRA